MYLTTAFVLFLLFLIIVFGAYIRFVSRGDLPNDGEAAALVLNERCCVVVNGVEQYYFVRSSDVSHPVLLFLHGGPGVPELPLFMLYNNQRRLEDDFTVCYWDETGSGMNWNGAKSRGLTIDDLVHDAGVVANDLCKRFGCPKIYLMGHSFGAYLGLRCAQKYPDLFFAYIGVGTPLYQQKSELLCWRELLLLTHKHGDWLSYGLLKCCGQGSPLFMGDFYLYHVRDVLLNRYGLGMFHGPGGKMSRMIWHLLCFRGYSIKEKCGYWMGLLHAHDLYSEVIAEGVYSHLIFDIPVYLIHGRYDRLVCESLTHDLYDQIQAPRKGFYMMNQSAHSPLFEESDGFVALVKCLLCDFTEKA